MPITVARKGHLLGRKGRDMASERRFTSSLHVLILATAFVWLCGSLALVGSVQAGGGGFGGGGGGSTGGGNITYVYDQDGQLIYVIDSSGNVINYGYDPDGNITLVATTHPSGVAIYGLSPSSGLVGASVTIFGIGFSTTAGSNTVNFNGTPATVISSTATTIMTTVPTNATTGIISVTSPSGAASGPTFTVQ
jgi:YD repeat-containing protein